jgi:hypothetical protein
MYQVSEKEGRCQVKPMKRAPAVYNLGTDDFILRERFCIIQLIVIVQISKRG